MKRATYSARRPRLRGATLCLTLFAACASGAFAQGGPRVVVENVSLPNHPVEVVAVDVAGKANEFAESRPRQFVASFEASEDWPRQFAFRIRNRSDKTITYALFYGAVGSGEEGDIPMGIEALYGRESDESAFTGRAPKGEPRRLAPGETAEVRWSADELEHMVRFLSKKRPLAAYRKMRVDLREVLFEDGTVWSEGKLYRIDPNDPRKWTALDAKPERTETPRDLKPGERVVDVDPRKAAFDNDSESLVVTEIKVNGQVVAAGQPFAAGADWLRGLTVRVRNDSAKPIASLRINFTIPEASYRAGGIGFVLRHPTTAQGDRGGGAEKSAKTIQPGEEAELSFTAQEYEAGRTFADRFGGVAEITRAWLTMAHIVFADGTRGFVSDPLRAKKSATAGGAR